MATKMNGCNNTFRLSSWKPAVHLVLFLLLFTTGNVYAQESGRQWTVKHEGATFGVYNTQEDAESAVKTIPGEPPFFTDAYQEVDTIKDQVITEDSVTYNYWMGLDNPVVPDWGYQNQIDFNIFATMEEAVASLVEHFNAQSIANGCVGSSVTPTSDWVSHMQFGNGQEMIGFKEHTASWNYLNELDGSCNPITTGSTISRHRVIHCPNYYTQWNDDYQACANAEIVVPVIAGTLTCEGTDGAVSSGFVGNPCDVKTGEKYETEQDFDFGWIEFTRYYHSGASNATGGFGYGWSHSHQIRLVVSPGSVGIIEGSGFQSPFRQSGADFYATDGSGDRLVHSGSQWLLYRSNEVQVFEASGRLAERHFENGNSLAYGYDAAQRLFSITHSSGRTLTLEYGSDAKTASVSAALLDGALLTIYAYNAKGQVSAVEYSDGGKRLYHYEDATYPRNLTGITGEDNQRFSTFVYDNRGRVVSSQHHGGADGVTLAYAAQGGAVVTNALGLQTAYGLTTSGTSTSPRKVSTVTDSAGTVTQTFYDLANDFRRRLNTVTDRSGVITKHEYAEAFDNEAGTQASIHVIKEAQGLPNERVLEVRRAISSNRQIANKVGLRETRYGRNARLQPATVTVKDTTTGLSRITNLLYCEEADVTAANSTCPLLGYLKSSDGPRTDVADVLSYLYYPSDEASCATTPTTCSYRKGDLWKTTSALGQVIETLNYDGAGRPLSVKNTNGIITDLEYHPRGWLTASKVRGTNDSTEVDDVIVLIEYWPTGLVKKVTQPGGAFTAYAYDAAHRLTDITDNAGNKLHYVLDNTGNQIQEDTKDPANVLKRTLSRVYNQLGQLQTQADAQANPIDLTYDANGNTDTVTDALGRVIDNDYDPLNRLSRTLQDVGGINAETKFQYDALDNLTQVTDPKGLNTGYTYNGFGDLIQLVSPDTGTTNYTYDSAGNRASQTDARGVTIGYRYDALNRLIGVDYPDATKNLTYFHDFLVVDCPVGAQYPQGRLGKAKDVSGTIVRYCYDRFGNVTRKLSNSNGKIFTQIYTYTKDGQLSSVTYPDGAKVDYVRDAQGRITEIGAMPVGRPREVLLNQVTYYPFGPVSGWTYGNGRTMQRIYNQNYQPVGINDASAGGLSLGFDFDAAGNLTKLTPFGNGSPLVSFDYDGLGRLTYFRDGPTDTAIEAYTYDATGNRTSQTDSTGTRTYLYPPISHRLSSAGGVPRSYDGAGNTTTIGGGSREFIYNDANRLSQVKVGGVVTMNYDYNGLGQQVRRYPNATSTAQVYTLYDETGHWSGDYDSTGTAIQKAIWLDDLPVGLIALGGAGNQRIFYVEPDHLGTPRTVVHTAKNLVIWTWDAKGEAFGDSAPNENPDANGSPFVLNLRFPGQRYDAATGLNYNYFRDYEPGTGRYSQSDPIGLGGGISTYAYVRGNPISRVDPLGLEDFECYSGRMTFGCPRPPSPPVRLPDYVRVQVSFYVFSGARTITRSGNMYVSAGVARGYPVSNPKFQASFSAGWLNQCERPADSQTDNFVNGFGMGGAAGYDGVGGGLTWSPGQGTATELGFGVGGGVSPGEISVQDGKVGGW